MLDAIQQGFDSLSAGASSHEHLELESVQLLAPIPLPIRNLFCVGWNYLRHFDEGRDARPDVELPDRPTFFSKATTTVTGPQSPIPAHSDLTENLDWEAELAVIIGKEGRDISSSEALDYVFGYTIANDITARDIQRSHGGQWLKGKSLDSTCPMGPVIVSADEFNAKENFTITCKINGEIVQAGQGEDLIFPIARLISELSRGMTLLPGDIILTGTPDGVGHHATPPRYLKPGDVIETSISGIGTMRNVVEAGP